MNSKTAFVLGGNREFLGLSLENPKIVSHVFGVLGTTWRQTGEVPNSYIQKILGPEDSSMGDLQRIQMGITFCKKVITFANTHAAGIVREVDG